MDIYSFLAITICLIPTILSLISIIRVGIKPFTLLQIIFFLVFVLPIFLDILNGSPSYYDFPGFRDSADDGKVNFLYNTFIIFISIFNWFFRGRKTIDISISRKFSWIDISLLLLTVSPLITVFFAPDLSYYYTYGIDKPATISTLLFHSLISLLTNISVVICAYLLAKMDIRQLIFIMLLSLIVFLDFWLNGKRAIVLIFILMLSLFYWLKNRTKNRNTIFLITILFIGFSIFNIWYQSNIRDFNSQLNNSESYENFRIDYFRDQRVKMVIYSIIYPERMKILEYSGQSFLFDIAAFVPRSVWDNKPYPYAVYFTSAIYYAPIEDRGWGMTTSIYDELLANFGFIGVLVFQIFLANMFNKVLRLNSKFFPLYVLFLTLLSFMVQIVAFMFLYILAVIWYIKIRNRRITSISTIQLSNS